MTADASRRLDQVAVLYFVHEVRPEYVHYVLNENFEDAKALFLSPLMAIHYAHLVMLAEHGHRVAADARRIREALDAVVAGRGPRRRRTTAPTRTCSSTSSACWSSRAATRSPAGCTRRAAATTST